MRESAAWRENYVSLKVQRKGDSTLSKSLKVAEERAMAPWVLSPTGKHGSGRQSASFLSADPLGSLSACLTLTTSRVAISPSFFPIISLHDTGMKHPFILVLWDALCHHVPTLKFYTSEPQVMTVFEDKSLQSWLCLNEPTRMRSDQLTAVHTRG